MSPRLVKRIAGFFLRFALAYAIAIALWPVIQGGYRAFYAGFGNLLFEGGEASVHFEPAPEAPGGFDMKLTMSTPKAPGITGTMANNSRFVGYLPTISLIAFVLATPIPWKRRRRALIFGLLFVNAFVAIRMSLPIIRDFSNPNALQVYHLGSFGRWSLELAQRALLHAPASWFIGPIFIWAAVAFRRDDWELIEAEKEEE